MNLPTSSAAPPAHSEPTFGTITAAPRRRRKSGGLLSIFLALVLIAGAFGGIYLFRPTLFERGSARLRTLLGLEDGDSGQKAIGPPFDAPAAGEALSQIAKQVSECKQDGGPTGKGRAQVLYNTDGSAASVAVSKPFHETDVGKCLIDKFIQTRVPAFGGDPVVVSKTFEIE